jgi:hypothetical protein
MPQAPTAKAIIRAMKERIMMVSWKGEKLKRKMVTQHG